MESASRHPDFRYFPESGEDRYEAFLGAPVVHAGDLVGVLVVEQHEPRRFSDEEEAFLAILAAHLGALNPADLRPEADESSLPGGAAQLDRLYEGVRGAPGVGIGRIVLLTGGADLMAVADAETDDTQGEEDGYCANRVDDGPDEDKLANVLFQGEKLLSSNPYQRRPTGRVRSTDAP